MKFVKEITPKGLLLPVTAARLSGFNFLASAAASSSGAGSGKENEHGL